MFPFGPNLSWPSRRHNKYVRLNGIRNSLYKKTRFQKKQISAIRRHLFYIATPENISTLEIMAETGKEAFVLPAALKKGRVLKLVFQIHQKHGKKDKTHNDCNDF